jgi:uncharacterized membrane protein (UPF0127 family)
MLKKLIYALGALVLLAGLYFEADYNNTGPQRPDFGHSTLSITRADGKVFPFAVEVATTPDQQAYGLMYIHSLPADAGMIFPYDPPQEVAFWMKNTLIPLDMLFVRPDHTITRIAANARPQDWTPIASEVPIMAVIEINGGQASKDGLAVGDKVDWPLMPVIGKQDAL